MKNYNWLSWIFLFFISFSGRSNELFEEGNKYYAEEHYKTAAKSYESILDSSLLNSEVYYNLGNAYFKSKRLGLAIWAYERALKIDPRNEDAKFNLEFANMKTEDQIEQPEPALAEWFRRLLFGPKINLWAFVSIASSLLFALMIVIFTVSKSRRIRNLCLMSGTLLLIVLVFSTSTAYFHKDSILDESRAIIVAKEVEVKVSPLEKAEKNFLLHEGSKVTILKEKEDWTQVELNGNSGWLKSDEIRKI